jgi:hypothetical protein
MQEKKVLSFPTPQKLKRLPPKKITIEDIELAVIETNGRVYNLPVVLTKRFKGLFSTKVIDDSLVVSISYRKSNYGLIIKNPYKQV